MEDPRTIILENIDILSCRVVFSASPIVLLCGGKVTEKERPEDPDPKLSSFRHAITLAKTSYELFRPEEITNWQSDAVFKNLMDYEADLASICSLVVIVLESAGAIAELGAFSQLPDLSRKIIVIKSDEFTEDTSFINLGILRYILEGHQSSVKTYPWNIDTPARILDEVVEDVVGDIQVELSRLSSTETFKPDNRTHVIVLICDLIRLFMALKENEILDFLFNMGIKLTKHQLKRKLFLLERFNLIRREIYSDSIFYLSGHDSYHKLRLSFKKGYYVDALRIPIECVEYYNASPKDKHRSRVIKKISSGDAS